MIVDPDFFDHWRTRMVADMLQDQLAPVYIMRLWAHCQNRKGDVFDIPAAGLKALCQFSGTAQDLEDALIAAEYITRDGLTVTVTGWAEKNAALLAAWENGNKGGRPKKNQNTTDGQPTENPSETHGLPMANPSLTQTKPIRVDKRREEEKKHSEANASGASAPPTARDLVFGNGVPLLTVAGVSEKNARSMLAGLCKRNGDEAVANAIAACAKERPVEPVSWLQAVLTTKPIASKQDALEARNRAVADSWVPPELRAQEGVM